MNQERARVPSPAHTHIATSTRAPSIDCETVTARSLGIRDQVGWSLLPYRGTAGGDRTSAVRGSDRARPTFSRHPCVGGAHAVRLHPGFVARANGPIGIGTRSPFAPRSERYRCDLAEFRCDYCTAEQRGESTHRNSDLRGFRSACDFVIPTAVSRTAHRPMRLRLDRRR